jgi:hypothetical protein
LFAPQKIETVSVRLPTFNGKNDPEIWISNIETILQGCNYPEDRWTMLIDECMKEDISFPNLSFSQPSQSPKMNIKAFGKNQFYF